MGCVKVGYFLSRSENLLVLEYCLIDNDMLESIIDMFVFSNVDEDIEDL